MDTIFIVCGPNSPRVEAIREALNKEYEVIEGHDMMETDSTIQREFDNLACLIIDTPSTKQDIGYLLEYIKSRNNFMFNLPVLLLTDYKHIDNDVLFLNPPVVDVLFSNDSERLILRRVTALDVPAVFTNWASDPLSSRYLDWDKHESIETTSAYIATTIAEYNKGGYQLAKSLFAIGTGSWFGMGLTMGMPENIPVADEDFVFSAICEEMGIIFGICIIFVCVSCYIMFLNIAMQLTESFYKLVALGLGSCYIFQTFLNIGGVVKFIPSTGVTLPLISYGGSSILSTMIMFAIIQGLYVLRTDEEKETQGDDYE